MFATTFVEGFNDPRFATCARKIEVPIKLDSLSKREFRFFDEVKLFTRVIRAAFQDKLLLLFSSRGRLRPELMAIISIGLIPKKNRPKIALYGEMFEPNHGARHLLERIIMKLVDRVVDRYILFSSDELDVFPATWGATQEKIRICNQFYFPPDQSAVRSKLPQSDHVFAGGNSFRNYNAFMEAAAQLPKHEFQICTTKIDPNENIPPNIKIGWPPIQEYLKLIDTAAAVVIPIQMGLKRTAGLLTCFESMWLEKTIIVPRALGMEDYIKNKVTGLLVDGSPESYVQAINWVLDPKNKNEVREMGKAAHKSVVEQFTLSNYVDGIYAVMDELAETA